MSRKVQIIGVVLAACCIDAGCSTTHGLTAVAHEAAASKESDPALAARHLSEAKALRAREARLCIGIRDEERELGLLAYAAAIEHVERLVESAVPKAPAMTLAGAIVQLRAMPGMTEQYLQRMLECHLAHHAIAGGDTCADGKCPLAVGGGAVRVRPLDTGFSVVIRSAEGADEVLRRSVDARRPK